jgi:hypothetical protein
MTTKIAATTQSSIFSPAEQRALFALRTRYGQDADRVRDREQAQLLFLRWLSQTGQLTESADHVPATGKEAPMITR